MRRILFVDDERRILEGLQRMLRPCRRQWEMAFATSGSEALAILEAGPFDVIVSDMRMPNMDGGHLLELVRQRHPGMIRIMLSGQCEIEAAMRAVPVAHQFLSKPCDPEKLRSVIENCFECASTITDFATRGVIASIGELPALPRTYAALVAALDDPKPSAERVSAIVECDLAVTAKLLQLVNSTFFGLAREVTSIPIAVAYLGFDVLKQLVIAMKLFRSFPCERQVAALVEQINRHSRCAAAIAAFLPVAAQLAPAVSVAALLHDIGKLVLAVRLPERFERALQASIREHRPMYSIEEEMTGTTHADIGAYLLGLWGLPPAVIAAVSSHHRPVRETENEMDLRLAVHIADLLAHEAEHRLLDPSIACENNIDIELRGWSEMLPIWRQSAAEIVYRKVESGQLAS